MRIAHLVRPKITLMSRNVEYITNHIYSHVIEIHLPLGSMSKQSALL